VTLIRRFLSRYGTLLWILFVVGFSALFLLRERGEIGRIALMLREAQLEWLIGILLLEALILSLVALTYQVLLRRLGHDLAWLPLVGIHLRRVVIGTVTPIGGPSSMYVFVRSLTQRGVPGADALLAISLKSVAGNLAFMLLLIPVLLVQPPTTMLLLSALALTFFVAVMIGALIVLLRRASPPCWLTSRLPRRALRFVVQARAHRVAGSALAQPFVYLLATKIAGVVMLYVALQAVGQNVAPTVPLIAYVVGMIFLLVAPVFQGIGFVEVSMALALERLGVPAPAAIGATLLVRFGELWLPLAMGLLLQAATSLHLPTRDIPRPVPVLVPVPVVARRRPRSS
jgi:uncharacterized membrane protein YbhN (UPF0104 family)